jgi:hypothetical protein
MANNCLNFKPTKIKSITSIQKELKDSSFITIYFLQTIILYDSIFTSKIGNEYS